MNNKGYTVSQKRYTLDEAKNLILPLLKMGVRFKLDDLAAATNEDNSDLVTCRIYVETGENYQELLDKVSPDLSKL